MSEVKLVADIGGTNARFALVEATGGRLRIWAERTLAAADFGTLEDAALFYLDGVEPKITQACFAVAGPVSKKQINFTNSHWVVAPDVLKQRLKLNRFEVINDFFALAAGVHGLQPDDFLTIKDAPVKEDQQTSSLENHGVSKPKLVVGPGTGYGQALIVPSNGKELVISTEGGHVSFAPVTERETAVMQYLAKIHGRVSVERVLSGGGVVNIHQALCALDGQDLSHDLANTITDAARAGADALALETVEMFCAILGGVVGDGVLAAGAQGGVILGGGILPKIQDLFLNSQFTERYLDKGRMRDYVDQASISLIIREGAAFYGAATVLCADDI